MTTITLNLQFSSLKNLAQVIKNEPAVVLYAANAATAIGVLWGFHLTADQTGALSVITTAAASVIVAILTRPVSVTTVKGSILTILTALQAFHFHATPATTGTTVAVLSAAFGLLFRQNLTPVATTNKVQNAK